MEYESNITSHKFQKEDLYGAIDNRGWTPIHHAAFVGNVEITKLLIKNKAKTNPLGNIHDCSHSKLFHTKEFINAQKTLIFLEIFKSAVVHDQFRGFWRKT